MRDRNRFRDRHAHFLGDLVTKRIGQPRLSLRELERAIDGFRRKSLSRFRGVRLRPLHRKSATLRIYPTP